MQEDTNSALDPEALLRENQALREQLALAKCELNLVHHAIDYEFSGSDFQSLMTLVSNSPNMISLADLNGHLLYLNPAGRKLLGIKLDSAIPALLSEYIHPDDHDRLDDILNQLVQQGTLSGELKLRNFQAENAPILIAFTSFCIYHPQTNELIGLGSINRDIREERQTAHQLQKTNDELIRATRLKADFLANMSHELRTPLNTLLGLGEALQENIYGHLNDQQIRVVRCMENSANHLLEIINDILDISKIEAGQVKLDYSEVDVRNLCRSSLDFIRQRAFTKGIQIETKFSDDLSTLYIDERRMRQVLINLLTNAVKFTPKGGKITLDVISNLQIDDLDEVSSESSHRLRMSIIDTGIGIAPENLNRLFQPFSQIDSALNRKYMGTGLGLAIVRQIVELHGGTVSVMSRVGEGSSFTIDIPAIQNVPESQEITDLDADVRHKPSDSPNRTISILLVEDDELNASFLSHYLITKGYHVIIANNGHAAIALAQSELPNLILMDIQMPGMDGLEAMRQIRKIQALVNIPIIALTALAMTGDRERCLEAGANDYVTKPVKLKQLVVNIQQLLADVE